MFFRSPHWAVPIMAIWGSSYVVIQAGLRDTTPLFFSSMRAVPAGLLILAYAAFRDCPGDAPRMPSLRDAALSALLGILTTTIFLGTMFVGTPLAGPGLSSVLINTQPLMVAFLARFFLGERVSGRQWCCMAAGFLGIVAITWPALQQGPGGTVLGIVLLLSGALSMSAGLIVAKPLYQRLDLYWLTGWQLLIGGGFLLLAALAVEDVAATRLTPRLVWTAAYLSVVGTAMAALLWFSLIRRHPVSRLASYGFLIPVFGLLLAWIVYREQFGPWALSGMTLVIVSLYMLSRTGHDLPPAPSGAGHSGKGP